MSKEVYIDITSTTALLRTVYDTYEIQASKIVVLAGEFDLNYRITTNQGLSYLLKVSNTQANLEEIKVQVKLQDHVADQDTSFVSAAVIVSKTKQQIQEVVNRAGERRYMRLYAWVDGYMLGEARPIDNDLLRQWGHCCGNMTKVLSSFSHPKIKSTYKWNPSETLSSRHLVDHFTNHHHKEIAELFWSEFEEKTMPLLPRLRKGVNHNDLHEQNITVISTATSRNIHGVIDFGDAMYTETICELAISAAYAGMNQEDPISAIAELVTGYHEAYPLEEIELEVLFSMITARLLITVSSAAENKKLYPDNEYLSVSERPAWDLLRKLYKVHPRYAHYRWRSACGLTPVPHESKVHKYISANMETLHPIMDTKGKSTKALDLSIGSQTLGLNENFEQTNLFKTTIRRWHEDHSVDIGYGGYLEPRPVYTTDAYRKYGNSGPRWRTIHLGLDLWTVSGTLIFAPLDGTVHSIGDNTADRDYGPTIILEHQIDSETSFYTLYGHLTQESLVGLSVGQTISKGEKIAAVGNLDENGGWPPHLHFQVIMDMLGLKGDFPGVAYHEDIITWQSLAINPYDLAGVGTNLDGDTDSSQLMKLREAELGANLALSYDQPLHIMRGSRQYLYDVNGRRYLDLVNNVAHVGHEHPHVVKAGQRQMAVLNTNTRYLHNAIVEYAKDLIATLPEELTVAYFVNSGSEANELALRMMEIYTQAKDVIALEVGYHGNTKGTLGVSSYKFDSNGGSGSPDETHIVPMPDTYRGLHRDPSSAGHLYANYVQKVIDDLARVGKPISGFICESILSCGGQIPLPDNYLKHVYKMVRAAGGLCIADEVQVGFGRVGKHFWGFDLQGVVPDIVTLGKPIGNGHPLAAVVVTQAVAKAFDNGMEYFNTFGGNPVSCIVGKEVLSVIKRENLQAKALQIGNYLKQKLQALQQVYPIIGDIRGEGLFLGVDLVRSRETREPANHEAKYIINQMRNRGFLMSVDGPHHNVLKIKPPLCISNQDIDDLCVELDFVLSLDACKV